jgi:hypothetical protein
MTLSERLRDCADWFETTYPTGASSYPSMLREAAKALATTAPTLEEPCRSNDAANVNDSDGIASHAAPSVSVAGRFEGTLMQFRNRARVFLADEQAKIAPDNALIAFVCDAFRLSVENEELAKQALQVPLPAPGRFTPVEARMTKFRSDYAHAPHPKAGTAIWKAGPAEVIANANGIVALVNAKDQLLRAARTLETLRGMREEFVAIRNEPMRLATRWTIKKVLALLDADETPATPPNDLTQADVIRWLRAHGWHAQADAIELAATFPQETE